MSDQSIVVYLRLKKRLQIKPMQMITLGQIARLVIDSKKWEMRLTELELYKHRMEDGNRVVIDLLQVVQAIKQLDPRLTIESFGDPQILLIVSEQVPKPRIAILLFSWVLLFIGAGVAIMNFHADVGMEQTQIRLVELITGERVEKPLWFQIPYSFGIGAGMVLFFNQLFRKKFNEEPNPLEVELFMYQENMNEFVISDEMLKKSEDEE